MVFSVVKTGSGSADGKTAAKAYITMTFNLFCVKTISLKTEEAYPMEVIEFEYGAVKFDYKILNPQTGALTSGGVQGWDRVKNVSWS